MSFLSQARDLLADLSERRDAKMAELDDFATLLESEKRTAKSDEDEMTTLALAEVRDLNGQIAEKSKLVADLEKIDDERKAAPAPTRRAHKQTAADPYDIELRTAPRTTEVRADIESRALKAIENETRLTDEQKHAVDQMLRNRGVNLHGALARHILATGRPAYRSAFAKLVRMEGGAYLTAEEAAALDEVRAINITTDGQGGYLMPFTLDPTVVLVNDGRVNPMRQLATVRTVATDNWQGVNTAGISASWDTESEEVSDDSPTFTQPVITVKNIKAFIPFTVEAEDDFDGLAQDATVMFNDAVDELEAVGFATGAGSATVPQGIVTGLVAAASIVMTAGVGTYARADLLAVSDAVPDRYDAGASWLMHRAIISLTRELGVDDDPIRHIGGGVPPELLDRPLYKYSALDGAVAVGNEIAVVGDIGRCYRINDRIGLAVERVPMLFGANGRPTGERGWFARKRVGAGVVNGNAARVLQVRAA